jgi:hypothetical protein
VPVPFETLKALGFDPDAIKPLGRFFTNDFSHAVVDTPEAFRVDPPANGAGKAYGTAAAVAGCFAVAVTLIYLYAPADPDRTIALVAFGILGVAAPLGLFGLGLARQRHFERRGPALLYDKAAARLHIPGGRAFDRADVVALLCLSLDHNQEGRSAELNLLAREGGTLKRYLLLTLLDGRVGALDYVAAPFVAATGLPAYRIWNKGFFGEGEIVVEPVQPVAAPLPERLSERQPPTPHTSS